jgi:hypothetical protein
MISLRSPLGTLTLLAGSALVGFVVAIVFDKRPEVGPIEPTEAVEWELPALRETGDGIQRIRSILSRRPWGGRLAEAGNDGGRRRDGPAEPEGQTQNQATARDVAQWRYLGSVRRGGAANAVFLDHTGEIVHLEIGSTLRGRLQLSVLEADHVVFESADGSRSVRLQLFGQTSLELEGRPVSNAAPESPPGEEIDD